MNVERRSFRKNPEAEQAELVAMLEEMGMTPETAAKAGEEIHRDEHRALNFHLVQELGVAPDGEAVAVGCRRLVLVLFAIGAIIPLIPYLLGFESLWAGLACGGVGLLVVGWRGGEVHPQVSGHRRAAAVALRGDRDCGHLCRRHPDRRRPHLMLRRILLAGAMVLSACGPAHAATGLDYLGQRQVAPGATLDGTVIGGLSGISYDPAADLYYIVSDDRSAKNPARFYTARITLSDNGIGEVEFVGTHPWLDRDARPFGPLNIDVQPPVAPPDPEAIAFDIRRQRLYWTSEGGAADRRARSAGSARSVGSDRRPRRQLSRGVRVARRVADVGRRARCRRNSALEGLTR